MDVGFWNLSYTPRSWKIRGVAPTLLKNVSGRFNCGELSAIMGPSGAGKSTLLNAVSGLTRDGVQGSLTVNGRPRDNQRFHKSSCYITQEALVQGLLTVHEIMMVCAHLKLPTSVTRKEKIRVVGDILAKLGLMHAAQTRTEKLSGGERKRLSIACELVDNPPVFFLDEPTSGLDDVSSKQTLRLLRSLARDGRTLVLTIHQPSAAMLALFDHVLVLARGVCVYQGAPNQIVPFLSDVGITCPRHYNPADFLMELTDGEDHIEFIELLKKATDNGKLNLNRDGVVEPADKEHVGLPPIAASGSESGSGELSHLSQSSAISDDGSGGKLHRKRGADSDDGDLPYGRTALRDQFATSGWTQFIVLLRRMTLQISRNRAALRIQFLHHTLCALLVGIIYYDVARDGSQFFTHMKFAIGMTLFFVYTHVMVPVLVFPNEVKLFQKEHFNRWYSLNAYYSALTVSKWPIMMCLTTWFLAILYYLSGLPLELDRFAIIVLIGIVLSLVAEGYGLFIGSLFNITNGTAVAPMSLAPLMGLAVYGFDFAPRIHWFILVLMKTSFLRCGVAAIVLTMFGFGRQSLDCNEMYCHFQHPRMILRFLDVEGRSAWYEILNLVVILAIVRLVFWCGLRYRIKK